MLPNLKNLKSNIQNLTLHLVIAECAVKELDPALAEAVAVFSGKGKIRVRINGAVNLLVEIELQKAVSFPNGANLNNVADAS